MDQPLPNPESNPRFQKIDKVALLSLCPLFSGLSQWELKSIGQLMRLVEYRKDEIVHEEGTAPGNFYVIVSGRLEASVLSMNKRKILSYLRRGDYFGEMSLLNNEPHSATVRALSDALLLALKKDDFKKTIEHNATVALEISRRLSSRLRATDSRSRALLKNDVISIYSNQRRIGRTAFSINLAASLFHETRQKTVLLDMSPSGVEIASKLRMTTKVPIAQFHNIENAAPGALSEFLVQHPAGFEVLNVAHNQHDERSRNIIVPLLNHLAVDFRFILIDLPNELDETVLTTLSQSDSLFFVTDNNINNLTEIKEIIADIQKNLSFQDDKVSTVINESFFGVRTTASAKHEIFGGKTCYSLPQTPEVEEHTQSRTMPYAVDEPDTEYSRAIRHIARRISNNLVGLALGSGAALGLAHIGVLKVLEREKIPIDVLSGSSIGALIGSLYAMNQNAAIVEKAALDINDLWRLSHLLDFDILPLRGLFHGKLIMRHFKSHLGGKTFEDCRIPFKVIGSNLTTRQMMVFESGSLSDAVRSSIAIPAIFKPIISHGEVIVDGGIMSPLPVRALQQAGANKIIAVNVFPSAKDVWEKKILVEEIQEKEEMAMKQRNFISRGLHRFNKALGKAFTPNVVDVLMNTIQTMETEIADIEGESADIVIRPIVLNSSWVDFFKPEQFVRRGEEETMKMLPKIKALVSQQNA